MRSQAEQRKPALISWFATEAKLGHAGPFLQKFYIPYCSFFIIFKPVGLGCAVPETRLVGGNMDFYYLAGIALLFVLLVGLALGCDVLGGGK